MVKKTLAATVSFKRINPLGDRATKNNNAIDLIINVSDYLITIATIYSDKYASM